MARFSLRNFRSVAAFTCFLLPAIIGFGLDQWTKKVAFEKLAPSGVAWTTTDSGIRRVHVVDDPNKGLIVYRFIPLWVHFQATANQGAVFGIGQGQRTLFILVSLLAIAFISYLFATSGRHRFYQFILGMLLAGVLGNMYDRLALGYVRDMIYIFPSRKLFGREVFPWIFNVADSLLCVGVFLIFVYSLSGSPKQRDDETSDSPAGQAA